MVETKHKESGITLIALIVTIVLLLILATITAYNGIDSYRKSQVMKFITEMQLIQGQVDAMANNNEYNSIGTAVSEEGMQSLGAAIENNELTSNESANSEHYRYLTVNDIANYLGIDNATSDIIVNFNTREVISVDGIEYNGEKYYTQYSLPGGQTIIRAQNAEDRTINSFDVSSSINGLNCTAYIHPIRITNGRLMYKLDESDSWTTISNYTKAGTTYEVNISVSGTYIFRLADNNNLENYEDVEFDVILTNAPKLEEDMEASVLEYDYTYYQRNFKTWFLAEKDSKTYAWLPRYAYKGEDIKFIRGNSKIATDDTYLDNTWTVPSKFGPNDTGIWVELTNEIGQNALSLFQDN